MTMAVSRPIPRTSEMTPLDFSCRAFNLAMKEPPSWAALWHSFSSRMTSRAAMATREANGLPPKVEPWEPGVKQDMMSWEDNTHETGSTPPERALPNRTMSGLASVL